MCKPVIAVLDPESSSGAMSVNEVHEALNQANAMFDTWGFAGDGGPKGLDCVETVFANEPIEWNRIGAFQDVTLRLIAERLLPRDHKNIYLAGELTHSKIRVPDSRARGFEYHLYVSPNNEGALEFIREVNGWLAARVAAQEDEKARRRHVDKKKRQPMSGSGMTSCSRTLLIRPYTFEPAATTNSCVGSGTPVLSGGIEGRPIERKGCEDAWRAGVGRGATEGRRRFYR